MLFDRIYCSSLNIILTRGTLPALPGIQNIQRADFFCQTATTQIKTQTFSIVMIISCIVAT